MFADLQHTIRSGRGPLTTRKEIVFEDDFGSNSLFGMDEDYAKSFMEVDLAMPIQKQPDLLSLVPDPLNKDSFRLSDDVHFE